ncbi:MAG: hypothetical protein ABSE06_12630, partial [Anaerolineaceae bacterium]
PMRLLTVRERVKQWMTLAAIDMYVQRGVLTPAEGASLATTFLRNNGISVQGDEDTSAALDILDDSFEKSNHAYIRKPHPPVQTEASASEHGKGEKTAGIVQTFPVDEGSHHAAPGRHHLHIPTGAVISMVGAGLVLAACGAAEAGSRTEAPPATIIPPIAEPTTPVPPTAAPPTEVPPTETPTNTPTPEPARPTADPNLSPQNNATMVLENSVWVVKNADGKVTASWDSAAGTWTYDYDNLKMQVGMVLPKFVMGMIDSISRTGTVTVPPDMLKPLPPSEQDPSPLVPSGHYGDITEQGTGGVQITLAEIGVDYRGIVLIDNQGFDDGVQTDEYAVIFTVQDPNHPDVIHVIVEVVNNAQDETLTINLDPSGARHLGPTFAQFIAMVKKGNPVGRRMSIMVQTSAPPGDNWYFYSPDNNTAVDAISAGDPIPAGLDVRLWAHNISIPVDLANLSK